ncbi:MAG: hypothetical protein BZ151_13145 [Desulfobacca sp. 4484_104]|nr:MAG: hypothetical protein BZ151_13145 [Desulfobacca sp. 4484_104]
MKLRCPACGSEFDLDQAVKDRDLEELIQRAARFGEDWALISEYLDGFRLRRDGALSIKKRLRLVKEVWEMWSTCRLKWGKEEYLIGRQEFREALTQVCNRELLGLKNHNYLKQVLKAAARQTSVRLEKERRDREERLGAGWRDSPSSQSSLSRGAGKGEEEHRQDAGATDMGPEERKEFGQLLKESLDMGRSAEERAAAKEKFQELMRRRQCQAE